LKKLSAAALSWQLPRRLSLIEKVVVQLPIALDLAAFLPRLQEHIGLSLVLIGPPLSGLFSQV
jgi:hypothetical protein